MAEGKGPGFEIAGLEDLVEIGRGGFAIVYRATQPRFSRQVAVKILTSPGLDDAAHQRFARECAAMGQLSWHPHVLHVYDQGATATGHPYLVAEYLQAGSLGDRLRRQGPLDWQRVLPLAIQVASALDAAHQSGLLHRDVKPDNILLDRLGNAKLADFGIAAVTGSTLTASGMVTASLAHAAPEVLSGKGATVRSDLYSLGSSIHMLLTGTAPFAGDTADDLVAMVVRAATEAPPALPSGIPPAFADVIATLLAKDPDDRYPDAAALAAALQSAQATTGQAITPIPTLDDEEEGAEAGPPPDLTETVLRPTEPPEDRTRIVTDTPRPRVPTTGEADDPEVDAETDLSATTVRPKAAPDRDEPDGATVVRPAAAAGPEPAEDDLDQDGGSDNGSDLRRGVIFGVGLLIALLVIGGVVAWFTTRPDLSLVGTWYGEDFDGSEQRFEIEEQADGGLNIRYFDGEPNTCAGSDAEVSRGIAVQPTRSSASTNMRRTCTATAIDAFGVGMTDFEVRSSGNLWVTNQVGSDDEIQCFTRDPDDSCD